MRDSSSRPDGTTKDEKQWQPGLLRRIVDSLFGYDFFISYTWSDGRGYAVELARRLKADAFECFLDSDDYAKGDDWKRVGHWTLRRTSCLVLIGSPNVHGSTPVRRELEIFHRLNGQVVPISFDGTLDPERSESPLFQYIDADILRIDETRESLALGPSDEVVNELRKTFKLKRQSQKRIRFFAVATCLFAVVAAVAIGFWRVAENRATELTVGEAYRLMELGTAQLAAGDWSAASESFGTANSTFVRVDRNPLIAQHRQLASELVAIRSEELLQTQSGRYVSALHVSDDGRLVAILFDYESRNNANEPTEEDLRTSPAVEIWDTVTGTRLAHHPPLSTVGMMVYRDFTSSEVEDLEELSEHNGPIGEVIGVKAPCDLIIASADASGNPTTPKSGLTQISVIDGSTYQPPETIKVHYERRSLTLEVPGESETIHIPGFFDLSPDDGIDFEYDDYIPEIVSADSRDGSRTIIGTYEGTVALFDARTGRKLRSNRLDAGVRDIKFIGDTHDAILIDQNGAVVRIRGVVRGIRRRIIAMESSKALDLSADGRVLAAIGDGELKIYDTAKSEILWTQKLPEPESAVAAFRVDADVHIVHIVLSDGRLFSIDYLSGVDEAPEARKLVDELAESSAAIDPRFVARIDLPRQCVWFAFQGEDGEHVEIEAAPLSTLGVSFPRRKIKVADKPDQRAPHAIVGRDREILLFVGDPEGFVDYRDAYSENIVRIPMQGNGEPETIQRFEPETRPNGPDMMSFCETVKRVIHAGEGGRWFLHTHQTVPMFASDASGDFRFRDAEAIVDVVDSEPLQTVAVTWDEKQRQASLCIEDATRELLYRAPLPLSGLPICSISADGSRIALATANDGIVFIDLSVFTAGTPKPSE